MTGLPAIAGSASAADLPGTQKLTNVPGKRLSDTSKSKDAGKAAAAKRTWKGAPAVELPKPGTADVEVPAKGGATPPAAPGIKISQFLAPPPAEVPAGKLPVKLKAVPAPTDRVPAAVSTEVEVKNQATATALGIDGVVMAVRPADASSASVPLSVELDYTKFRNAYGGNWGSRLQLVELPACALTSPAKPECQKRTPVASKNNPVTGTVTATLAASSGAQTRSAASAPTVLATTAGASGSTGTFTATSLSPTGSWESGGNSGTFSWSYPMEIPSSLGGPAPTLGLGYSAAAVDGRTSASSSQSSWAGDGWDVVASSNFIERTFVPCADDKKAGSGFNNPKQATGDLCHGAPMMTMSLNGASTPLVLADSDATKKTWRPAQDDGSRVELLDGAVNGDTGGQHWRVTTAQGIQYHFGLNRVPGWSTGKEETNSTFTVPVYGNHPGEECYKASYAASVCDQAWRWNLDYVVDPRGNAMTYWYAKERNHYGSNVQDDGSSTARPYDRGGWLKHIDYGLRSDNLFTLSPARIDFKVDERCIKNKDFDCAEGKLVDGAKWDVTKNWPDVPADQICDAGKVCKDRWTPTFFSRKMLKDVTTSVLKNGKHEPVDTWVLTQDFRATGDGGVVLEYPMWLAQIQHFGKNGPTEIPMPPVVFDGVQLENRVDNNEDGSPPFLRWRVEKIRTETGAVTAVKYAPTECSTKEPKNLPSSAENNTLRCYPVIKEVPDPADPKGEKKLYFTDWFHKHRVDQVREEHPNAISPTKETNYQYVGTPAWAYDDETEQLPEKSRTWSQWRGYERVRTLVGSAPDPRSQVESVFFRGLDGDKAPSQPGGKRSVKVKDSEGGEIADHKLFAGQTRETLYFHGENGPLESASVTTPMLKGPTATRKRADGAAPLESWISGVDKVSSRTVLSDNRGQRRTAVEHTYDERGRVTKTTDRGDLAKATDDSCILYEYKDDAAKGMFAQQSRVETLSKACDATDIARPADVVSDTRVEYDAVGNVVKGETLASYEGSTPKYVLTGTSTHDAYGRITSATDVYGAVTRTAYTPAAGGIVTKVATTNQLGHTTVNELDAGRGVPLAEEDANKRRTSMRYDALGRLTKAWSPDRDPDTTIPDAEFSYDIRPGSADAPVVITNKTLLESGNYRVRYDLYDGSLRLRQTQQQALDGGRVLTDTFYDSRGQVRMENGGYYNDQSPSSQMWVPVESKIPSSTVTQYDGMGRPVATIARKSGQETWRTTTAYGGDWIAVDPPKGDTPTKAILDAQGRKTELQQFTGDGPSGPVAHSIKYAYTPKGQLESVTDQGGNVWSYKYDLRGRPYEASDPDRGLRKTTYDIGDRVQTITDSRNKTIAVAYDALGRATTTHEGSLQGRKLTEQTYDTLPGALGLPVSSTRYDESGNAYTQAVTGYDAEYRPLASKIVIPANEGKLAGTYTYNNTYTKTLGMPQSVQFPATAGLPADRMAIGYNGLDQAHSASVNGRAFLTGSEFSKLGDLTRTHVGDANKQIVSTFEFDEQTRRPTRTYSTQQTGTTGYSQISDVTTKYDDAGNVLKITDKQDGSVSATDTQCFAYDPLRRMSDAWTATDDCALKPGSSGPGSAPKVGGPDAYWHSYTFDAVGNRTSEVKHDPAGNTAKDVTRSHVYSTAAGAKNQLLKVDTKGPEGTRTESYGYDAGGNTTRRTLMGNTQTLDWDIEGHLKKVTAGEGATAKDTEYLYDAQGNRLIRRDPTGTTLYLPGTEVHVAKSTQAVKGTRYYSGPNGAGMVRVAEAGKITTSYQLADRNGTATTSVDAATQAVTRRKFTPFGETRGQKPSMWPGEQGFLGGTADESTGLTHLGAREYDPAIGRFISVDPLMDTAESQTMNPYSYALNSPVTFSDPTGLAAMIIIDTNDPSWANDPRRSQWEYTESHTIDIWSGRTPAPSQPKATVSQADVERAKKLKAQSKADIALSIAKEVFKGVTGYDDIVACIGGDLLTCGMLAVEQAFGILGKAKRFAKAMARAVQMFKKWSDEVSWAVRTLGRADDDAKAMAKYSEDMASWQRKADADAAAAKKADEVKTPASEKADSGGSGGEGGGGRGSKGGSEDGPTCNSFTPGTQVLMADGTTKAIEELELGDKVVATDPETGETAVKDVAATIIGEGSKNLVEVTVDTDGDKGAATAAVTATDGHPFWVPEIGEWVDATDLEPGTWLRTSAGTRVQVSAVKRWTQQAKVHNLTVAGIHTYYVMAATEPVLVHNCDEPSVDELSAAANTPEAGKKGFTRAGFELQKHANRVTNTGQWPVPQGKKSPYTWSPMGQDVVDDLLTNPKSAVQRYTNSAGDNVVEYLLPHGGVQFRQEGGQGPWVMHSLREWKMTRR
ncbi:polymorphic toxin-type HINT domain-containing protein [Streptomyces virginiae]|uniref:polymorphic toxin-type HINT domain-containing protein n=1 Tax=Streptomyces virginiae TaxID=1961 RepID=UPI0033ABBD8B